MKKWTATLDIKFVLTEKTIQNDPFVQRYFKDPNNPTDKEIRKYFERKQDQYSSSNDGSEILANAPIWIEETNVED